MEGKKVSFFYFDYNAQGERVFRKNKKGYVVNPYATVFSNDNYYLVGYGDKYRNVVHYRIDRMDSVEVENEDIVPIPDSINFDVTEQKSKFSECMWGKRSG